MKTIDLVFFDAGGGHRSAANALKQVMEEQKRPWDVRLVNLNDVLDPIDFFKRITGIRAQDVYNLVLKKGWTLGSPQMAVVMHWIIRSSHDKQVALLREFWKLRAPDLLVSLVPNFNRSMHESLQPATRMVTILTDMADYPPHFWMERQEQYFICGTRKAVEQAKEMGHPEARVFLTSGMVLNPRFYEPVNVDRAVERKRLGLDPDLPTALVLFGGHGSRVLAEIARRLNSSGLRLQSILMCGHSTKLADGLRAMKKNVPMHVEGFTREVPYFMHLSDFLIGKPGPGSISEAMAMKLPVIVESNAWTLPQERFNAEWVREQGVGMRLDSFRGIVNAVKEMLEPANYEKFRAAVAKQNNRAVFEIPDMLAKILGDHVK